MGGGSPARPAARLHIDQSSDQSRNMDAHLLVLGKLSAGKMSGHMIGEDRHRAGPFGWISMGYAEIGLSSLCSKVKFGKLYYARQRRSIVNVLIVPDGDDAAGSTGGVRLLRT